MAYFISSGSCHIPTETEQQLNPLRSSLYTRNIVGESGGKVYKAHLWEMAGNETWTITIMDVVFV